MVTHSCNATPRNTGINPEFVEHRVLALALELKWNNKELTVENVKQSLTWSFLADLQIEHSQDNHGNPLLRFCVDGNEYRFSFDRRDSREHLTGIFINNRPYDPQAGALGLQATQVTVEEKLLQLKSRLAQGEAITLEEVKKYIDKSFPSHLKPWNNLPSATGSTPLELSLNTGEKTFHLKFNEGILAQISASPLPVQSELSLLHQPSLRDESGNVYIPMKNISKYRVVNPDSVIIGILDETLIDSWRHAKTALGDKTIDGKTASTLTQRFLDQLLAANPDELDPSREAIMAMLGDLKSLLEKRNQAPTRTAPNSLLHTQDDPSSQVYMALISTLAMIVGDNQK